MWKDFKAFLLRGSVVDLAIGVVIGAAFGAIVNSFVTDILMPPIGLLLGGVDFANLFIVLKQGMLPGPYATITEAQQAGAVTLNYGLFGNRLLSFLIIAAAVFLVVRGISKLYPAKTSLKSCPYCRTKIAEDALRCPACKSEQTGEAG